MTRAGTCVRGISVWLALLPASLAVMAQVPDGWDFAPRVSVGQTFSDNIELAPKGEEDSESVTRLDAGFALNRVGSQARARLDYNLLGLAYWDNGDSSDVFQQFDGDARVDLLPERFFVEASAAYEQRQVDRDQPGDILTTGVDRTDVLALRVSPVFVRQFEDVAATEFRYAYDRVDYSESTETDSERNSVLATVRSGPAFSRLGWQLSFDWSEEDFDDGSSVTLQRAEILGRWNFTERLSVFGVVGDEDNEFEQDPSRIRPDDTFWRLGATFEPTPRTFMEGFFGDRFFGNTYGAVLRHELRDGRVFADYSESLRTVNEVSLTPIRDADGNLVFEGDAGRPVFELPDVRTGVFLRKRFNVGLTFLRPKTTVGLRAFNESRDFEVTDQSERVTGVVGDITWRLQPRTRVFANLRLEETTFADDSDRDDTLFTGRIGVARDLGQRGTASIDYSYRDLDSSESFRDYTENRVTATFNKTF